MAKNALAQAVTAAPGPTNDPLAAVISARLKQRLVDILTDGVPMFDKMTGEPVMKDGKPVHRPPSAAELSVCERLVARAVASGSFNDHDEVQKVLAEMRAVGLKFPEIDTESDDEATR